MRVQHIMHSNDTYVESYQPGCDSARFAVCNASHGLWFGHRFRYLWKESMQDWSCLRKLVRLRPSQYVHRRPPSASLGINSEAVADFGHWEAPKRAARFD